LRTLVIGALACALALSACSKAGDQSAPGGAAATTAAGTSGAAGSTGGQLRIAIQRAPNTLNPLLNGFSVEAMINRLSFDTLLSVDASGKKLVPILATEVPTESNGGIGKDGLTITYHLRSGVRWHDGVPFTSKDVKFTWQAMMNEKNNVNERVGYEDVKSVDTPNATTVVFRLKHKFAPFVNTVFAESDSPVCIVPEHILAKYPDVNRIPFNEQPIGTGPFKLVRWVRGDHIELAANDDYFRGKPKLRSIILREIPDENTSLNALRSHDIDWIFEGSPNLYMSVKSLPDVKVAIESQFQTLGLDFNTSHPPLDDVRVRRAFAYAIDKQALVDRFTGGIGTVAWANQPPYSWAYEPNVMRYPFSVAKAKQTLKEAGWVAGPDGIARKNGQPLSLQLAYNVENATRRLVVVQIQAMLKAIGVDAQIKAVPANLYYATYGQGGILINGKYDMGLYGWTAGYDPDDHSIYSSDQIGRPDHPDGSNYTRYNNPEMDAAEREALSTYDEAKRKKAYSKIQKLIARDVPEDYIWFPRQIQPISPKFKGFAPNPVNEAWNAYEWEI
jgi:peptide/nickel transport system substrate-binding protein